MLPELLPAERAGAIRACVPDGLPVIEDLLPLLLVPQLLGGERSGPLVDLGKPVTDGSFEPVIRDLRPGTKTSPDLRDEPGPFLKITVQFPDEGCLLYTSDAADE